MVVSFVENFCLNLTYQYANVLKRITGNPRLNMSLPVNMCWNPKEEHSLLVNYQIYFSSVNLNSLAGALYVYIIFLMDIDNM